MPYIRAKVHTKFCSRNVKLRGYLGDLVVNWRITLIWILRICALDACLTIMGCCEYGNELSSCMKGKKFLN